MERYKKFIIFWLVNVVLLLVSAMLFPFNFTLGNSFFSSLQAAVFVGLVWNLVLWYTGPFFEDLELKLEEPMQMMAAYLLMNFATLWILARLAVITGLGVSSWMYVLGLALVGNFLQYYVWQSLESK